MFSEYCSSKFTIEPVDVIYEEDGRRESYPDLSNREASAKVRDVNSMIFGKSEPIDLDTNRMCELCDKMQLSAEYCAASDSIRVQVHVSKVHV